MRPTSAVAMYLATLLREERAKYHAVPLGPDQLDAITTFLRPLSYLKRRMATLYAQGRTR